MDASLTRPKSKWDLADMIHHFDLSLESMIRRTQLCSSLGASLSDAHAFYETSIGHIPVGSYSNGFLPLVVRKIHKTTVHLNSFHPLSRDAPKSISELRGSNSNAG